MGTDTGVNDRMEDILDPIDHGILGFLGVEVLPPSFSGTRRASRPQGVRLISKPTPAGCDAISDGLPIPYPTVDMFDENWRPIPRHLAQAEAGSF